MAKYIVTLLWLTLICSPIAHSADRPRISAEEAKSLVIAGLPLKTRQLPQFEVDQDKEGQPGGEYYNFYALWAGLPNGSVTIGTYAVDPSTGDVFDSAMECEELSTPELQMLQATLRSKIGLSDSEYHTIKKKGPLCG
jgi:hypothetical protein